MKNLSVILTLVLGALTTQTIAQQINSNLTSNYYLSNPQGYLSKLDNSLISSGILLDRALPISPINDYSGSGTVLTGTFNEWSELFFEQMNATQGGYKMEAWLALEKIYLHRVRDENIVPILIQNMKYNKVNAQALANGLLYEQDSFLVEDPSYKSLINAANQTQREQMIANLYSEHSAFASSVLYSRIHGNSITFELDSNFYFSNIHNETIQSMEVDFGNGSGYQLVDWNTPVTVAYTGSSAFIECAVKFDIVDNHNVPQTLYSYFTVLRTGDDVVPSLDGTTNGRASINPGERFYFPDGPTGSYETDVYKDGERQFVHNIVLNYLQANYQPGEVVSQHILVKVCLFRHPVTGACMNEIEIDIYGMYYLRIWKADTASLEVSILYAPNNTSGKLRKPIVILDGFDPGNKRSYYVSYGDDNRGLYEVMNGNTHKYYANGATSNTISLLRDSYSYDLVFIDFLNGDDDMQRNGDFVIELFSVLNGAEYRNEYTQESIVVGPSMGGLISRYALKTMEDTSTPYYVRQWISFDSPHQGAYVPVALQFTLDLLQDKSPEVKEGLKGLKSKAAKQLLLYHFEGDVDNSRQDFMDLINGLEYPNKIEKIAVSNGSLVELYGVEDSNPIINFRAPLGVIKIWGYKLNNTYNQLILRSRGAAIINSDTYGSFFLPYENMPGGYLDHLSLLSGDENNTNNVSGVHQEIATHIPLLSALGVPITSDNYSSPALNEAILTSPFDKFHFQPNIDDSIIPVIKRNNWNQIHMTITNNTKLYILDEMEGNKTNIQVPFVHSSITSRAQTVTGKVAYNGVQTVTFCTANGNDQFILEPTAVVTSTAPTSITLNRGFHAKTGSGFSARIVTTNGGRIANSEVATTTPINYANTSGYANTKHQHQSATTIEAIELKVENNISSGFSVYPTISKGVFTIASKVPGDYNIEVINSLGQNVINSSVNLQKIDITNQTSGFYFVRITSNNKSYLYKILKE